MNEHARIRRPILWVATALLCFTLLPHNNRLAAEESIPHPSEPRTYLLSQTPSLLMEGRCRQTEDGQTLEHPGSGLTFRFYGSGTVQAELWIDFLENTNHTFFTVLVDGQRVGDARGSSLEVMKLYDHRSYSLTLAENLPEGEHEISLFRQNEAGWARITAHSITCNGSLLPPPTKRARIEFIGDSITAGYGIYTDATSYPLADPYYGDATNGYAFETSRALNLQLSLLAASGYGLVAGWGTNNLMPQTYPFINWFLDPSSAGLYSFDPPADFVCINLGTNDWNVIGSTEFSQSSQAPSFYNGVIQFTQLIREKNPDARILWIYGMMGDTPFNAQIRQAVQDLGGEAKGIYSLALPPGTQGLLGHPDLQEQRAAATVLTQFLTPLLDQYFPKPEESLALQTERSTPTLVGNTTIRPSQNLKRTSGTDSSPSLHKLMIGLTAALVGMLAALATILLRWKRQNSHR